METFILKRVVKRDDCTQGVLINRNRAILLTMEDAWKDNQTGISCIPTGVYRCRRHTGGQHPNTWELIDVPNRVAILIHSGNTEVDTEGCILLGSEFGVLNGKPAVRESKMALEYFMAVTHGLDAIEIDIRDA